MSITVSPKAMFPTLGSCPPASAAAAGTITTGGTYLQVPAGATKLKATLFCGTVGSTPTAALSALQATSGAGAGSKACAGITATFATVANTVVQADFDLTQVLDINGGFNFIQLTITNNAGSASIIGAEFETNGSYLA
jgi:hypothetical protein